MPSADQQCRYAIIIAASDPNKKLSPYKAVQANGTLTITQVSVDK